MVRVGLEAARTVRTNLLFMNPDRSLRAPAGDQRVAPEEGKTTVACNLAIALAQSGQRGCIVDCDLRRPRLHRIFGRQGELGVTNVIVGEASVEDVAKETVVPKPIGRSLAGPTPPNPADLLHSKRDSAVSLQDLSQSSTES